MYLCDKSIQGQGDVTAQTLNNYTAEAENKMIIYKARTDLHWDTASGLEKLPHDKSRDDIAFSFHDA